MEATHPAVRYDYWMVISAPFNPCVYQWIIKPG